MLSLLKGVPDAVKLADSNRLRVHKAVFNWQANLLPDDRKVLTESTRMRITVLA